MDSFAQQKGLISILETADKKGLNSTLIKLFFNILNNKSSKSFNYSYQVPQDKVKLLESVLEEMRNPPKNPRGRKSSKSMKKHQTDSDDDEDDESDEDDSNESDNNDDDHQVKERKGSGGKGKGKVQKKYVPGAVQKKASSSPAQAKKKRNDSDKSYIKFTRKASTDPVSEESDSESKSESDSESVSSSSSSSSSSNSDTSSNSSSQQTKKGKKSKGGRKEKIENPFEEEKPMITTNRDAGFLEEMGIGNQGNNSSGFSVAPSSNSEKKSKKSSSSKDADGFMTMSDEKPKSHKTPLQSILKTSKSSNESSFATPKSNSQLNSSSSSSTRSSEPLKTSQKSSRVSLASSSSFQQDDNDEDRRGSRNGHGNTDRSNSNDNDSSIETPSPSTGATDNQSTMEATPTIRKTMNVSQYFNPNESGNVVESAPVNGTLAGMTIADY